MKALAQSLEALERLLGLVKVIAILVLIPLVNSTVAPLAVLIRVENATDFLVVLAFEKGHGIDDGGHILRMLVAVDGLEVAVVVFGLDVVVGGTKVVVFVVMALPVVLCIAIRRLAAEVGLKSKNPLVTSGSRTGLQNTAGRKANT